MIRRKTFHLGMVAILAVTTCCLSIAQAKKPTEPPGGGGGPGSDVTVLYDVLEVPLSYPTAMSDPNGGIITIAGTNRTPANSDAGFVRVRVSDWTIMSSGWLPVPELIDPQTSLPADTYSYTFDVNNAGTIVGEVGVPGTSPNVQVSVVWEFDGARYQFAELPDFNDGDAVAFGVNNAGKIVGRSGLQAVYWDPITRQVHDLNTEETAELGWDLLFAEDINDAGQIVGMGTLNGSFRGFLIDADGQIYAVPLVGPATGNVGRKIDEFGRVIGWAWDGTGHPTGPDADYLQAYSWDGPGTDATVLPSVTGGNSLANGVSELGQIAGQSYIPGVTEGDVTVATLWGIAASGQVAEIDLNSVVDSPWTLLRGTDCNNLGWISVEGKRSYRGGYRWNAVLLIPRPISND